MRKILLVIYLLSISVHFLFSQENYVLFKVISFDAYPANDCEVYVNGELKGYTRDNGTYDFYYDSKEKSYLIEIKSTIEKVSKRFSINIKDGKPELKSDFIGFNQLGAYFNIEKSDKKIDEMLVYFKDAGVTDLFVPVFFDGKTIYPSKVKGIKSSKKDLLKDVIELAKKLNIRVHAVLNVLNWGDNTEGFREYLMTNRKGNWDGGLEKDKPFVSPAHPFIIQTLVYLTRELAINYRDLYGISFDYLRYKKGNISNYIEDDFGYEENSVKMFQNTYHIDPFSIKPDTNKNSNWYKWIEHKENLLINLLVKMISAVKDTNNQIKITVSADPNYLYNRGKDLSCENYNDISEFARVDYFLMQVSYKNLENDLKALEPFITKTLPMIYCDEKINEEKFNKLIDYLKANRYDYFFGLYDSYLFASKNNCEKLIDLTFRR